MKQNDSRLDAVMNRLSDIPGEAADATDRVFEKASGELLFHEEGAPDRERFPETDDGYRQYLDACHEWSRSEYVRLLERLEAETTQLRETAEDYPPFGAYDGDAVGARDQEDEHADDLVRTLNEAVAERRRLKRIEAEVEG